MASQRLCVDFRNLNLATPKDEYPMPIADLLVDSTACNCVLSLLDAHSGYNQVPIAEEDINKTSFRCPGPVGAYEWRVMRSQECRSHIPEDSELHIQGYGRPRIGGVH